MSVRIMTKVKLDSNAYRKLIIKEEEGNFFITVSGNKIIDDRFKPVTYKLTDGMKKMNDSEKIITIVDSFLENAFISSIELSSYCLGSPGLFIKVSGSRELYLRIDDKELRNKALKMIESKYERDRYYYLDNIDIKDSYNIVLNKDVSCYCRKCVYCDECEYHGDCKNKEICPGYIQIRLMYSNGEMASYEEKFIERFVYDKLWEVGLNANVIETVHDIRVLGGEKVGTVVDGYCVTCGDLRIMFNCSSFSQEYIMNICNSIVNRYNNELSERDNSVKKKQLKMEGF